MSRVVLAPCLMPLGCGDRMSLQFLHLSPASGNSSPKLAYNLEVRTEARVPEKLAHPKAVEAVEDAQHLGIMFLLEL